MQLAKQIARELHIYGPESNLGWEAQCIIEKYAHQSWNMIQAILEQNGFKDVYALDRKNTHLRDIILNSITSTEETVICESEESIFLILSGKGKNPTNH